MTKNSDTEPIGLKGADATRGRRATRIAGQRGLRFIDPAGNDVIAVEWQVIGATVSGDDDDVGILIIGGDGGTGGGGGDDTSGVYSRNEANDLFQTRRGGEGNVTSVITASGSAQTLDLAAYNTFDITLTANCALTFIGTLESGVDLEWTIILRQDSTGSRTVTWPAEVEWQDTDGTSGGAAPTLFTAATAETVIVITTLDGGVSYGGGMEGAGTGGASALDDLSDVVITSPAADQQLQYVGGSWVNNARRWEPVTTNPGSGPEIVFDGDDIVMTWRTY